MGFSHAAGQDIAYSFVVSNAGSTAISSVAVSDTKVAPITCPANALAIGASMTCTGTYTTTAADVMAGSIADTVTVTATPASGSLSPATASGTIALSAQPSWSVTGSINPTTFSAAGEARLITIAIANTGNVPVAGISLGGNGATCPQSVLAPGASMNCTHAYVTTSTDVSTSAFLGFSLLNYTATSTTSGISAQPLSIRLNFVAPSPSMTIAMSATPATYAAAGQTITYSFTVRNTGTVAISGISLTDTRSTAIACLASDLAVGASTSCSSSYVTTAANVSAATALSNTVTGRGTPAGGTLADATATSSVEFQAQPSWTLTSTPSQATYSVSPTLLRYSHLIRNTGSVSISSISISESRGVALSCPQTTLAALASMTCSSEYMVSANDVSAAVNLSNTVTVHGTPASGTLADAAATSAVSFLGQPALALSATANPGGFAAIIDGQHHYPDSSQHRQRRGLQCRRNQYQGRRHDVRRDDPRPHGGRVVHSRLHHASCRCRRRRCVLDFRDRDADERDA